MLKQFVHKKSENFQTYSSISQLEKIVDNYKVVTFDIFDTLIKRDVPEPTDIFSILESKFSISDFKRRRIIAEKKSRENSENEEVTLDEIYSYLSDIDGYMAIEKAEEELEISECVPNLDILPFFKEPAFYNQVSHYR